MERRLITLIGLMACIGMSAKMPTWVIEPEYDTISVKIDNQLLQGELNGKTTLWKMDGNELFGPTDYLVLPFKEDIAVLEEKDSYKIPGFLRLDGKYVGMSNASVAYNNPFFEDGYLLVKQAGKLVYINRDGNKVDFGEVARSYPFHGGYAPFFAYDNAEKLKDPYYGYFNTGGVRVDLNIMNKDKVKPLNPTDVSFVSGVSADGKAIGVIKNKLYWFNKETNTFEPFLWGNEESEKKRHLTLSNDYSRLFLDVPEGNFKVNAQYGKGETAVLEFDEELRPVSFLFSDGTEMTFTVPAAPEYKYKTNLAKSTRSGTYGLSHNGEAAVPVQFEDVTVLYDDNAIVKKDGRWGIIKILPNLDYTLQMNKGKTIGFRHKELETQIRLDLPAEISARKAYLNIPGTTECILDKTSREYKDTESGNFVTYTCKLTIPPTLTDTITKLEYQPIQIEVDGIKLFDTSIDVDAWYLKYITVDQIEGETTINNGVASFEIKLNADRNDSEDYPITVSIEAGEETLVNIEKIAESRYKCTMRNLAEGTNNISILVTEDGCPPAIFPFEVEYTKPVPARKKKEAVAVRKRNPSSNFTMPLNIE